jgi:hypothetical protein
MPSFKLRFQNIPGQLWRIERLTIVMRASDGKRKYMKAVELKEQGRG